MKEVSSEDEDRRFFLGPPLPEEGVVEEEEEEEEEDNEEAEEQEDEEEEEAEGEEVLVRSGDWKSRSTRVLRPFLEPRLPPLPLPPAPPVDPGVLTPLAFNGDLCCRRRWYLFKGRHGSMNGEGRERNREEWYKDWSIALSIELAQESNTTVRKTDPPSSTR